MVDKRLFNDENTQTHDSIDFSCKLDTSPMPLEKVDKTNYPTEGEKERLQSLAKQLKGLNAFQRKTIYDEMVQIIDPYITKAYIERLDEELKKFAPVSNTK